VKSDGCRRSVRTEAKYPHVEEDAARHTLARQSIQQMLSRSIGRDLVTGVFQTTFYRRSERGIVIDYMHKPRQGVPKALLTILPRVACYKI